MRAAAPPGRTCVARPARSGICRVYQRPTRERARERRSALRSREKRIVRCIGRTAVRLYRLDSKSNEKPYTVSGMIVSSFNVTLETYPYGCLHLAAQLAL